MFYVCHWLGWCGVCFKIFFKKSINHKKVQFFAKIFFNQTSRKKISIFVKTDNFWKLLKSSFSAFGNVVELLFLILFENNILRRNWKEFPKQVFHVLKANLLMYSIFPNAFLELLRPYFFLSLSFDLRRFLSFDKGHLCKR